MLNLVHEKQDNNSYIIYTLDSNEKIDLFSMGMLVNNKIDGIIPFALRKSENAKQLKFNITNKIILAKYFSGIVSDEKLVDILLNMTDAVVSVDDYMLDAGCFILDPNYIYINPSSFKVEMLYFPVINIQTGADFCKFIQGIIQNVKLQDGNNNMLGQELRKYLNNGSGFDIITFRDFLKEKQQQLKPDLAASVESAAKVLDNIEAGIQNSEANVVSGNEDVPFPYILRLRTNQKVAITKSIFKIGKSKNLVDYPVTDNSSISRCHADIINKNGILYIRDNNSTNHTFVNGERIEPNTDVKLVHGTKINLANEEFIMVFH